MSRFTKMHGLGNDFVIFDLRSEHELAMTWQIPTSHAAPLIADRRRGIGCDQILILRKPIGAGDLYLEMWNADGSQTGACGNGTRCVADLVMTKENVNSLEIETDASLLHCWRVDDEVAVDMGAPKLEWDQVPLAKDVDTSAVDLNGLPNLDIKLPPASCLSMGNPHAVLFYDWDDLNKLDIAAIGSRLEHHPLFPEHANIEFVSVINRTHLRMRVWERGVGITEACGSGACAAAVAAMRAGFTDRSVTVTLGDGFLGINWLKDGPKANHVIMTGPVSYVAEGHLKGELFNALELDKHMLNLDSNSTP